MARRSEHTRQELKQLALEAALRLARHQGLSGLTARKIANEMGYTPGTLYLIFENLDELILHVNAQTLDDIYELMQSRLTLSGDSSSGVHSIVDAYMQFATDNQGLWSCLHEHKIENGKIPEWFESRINRNFKLLETALSRVSGEKGPGLAVSPGQPVSMDSVFEINSLAVTSDGDTNSLQMVARALWCAIHGVCVLAMNSSLNVAGVDSTQTLVHYLTDASLRSLEQEEPCHAGLELSNMSPAGTG